MKNCIISLILLLFSHSSLYAQIPKLLTQNRIQIERSKISQPEVKARYFAYLNANNLGASTKLLEIETSDKKRYTIEITKRTPQLRGYCYTGKLRGYKNSQVILAKVGKVISAHIILPNSHIIDINYAGNGRHRVIECSEYKEPSGNDIIGTGRMTQNENSTVPIPNRSLKKQAPPVNAGATSIFDLMVVYTTGIKNYFGGVAGIEAKILSDIATGNQVFINSGLDARINLVAAKETGYYESGSMETDLLRMYYPDDGQLDIVHRWRNEVGADFTSLYARYPTNYSYYGLGFLCESWQEFVDEGFDYAFTIIGANLQGNTYTLIHEMGHNLGCSHEATSGYNGIFPYSYAHSVNSNASIMYGSLWGRARIPYFSSPNVYYNGRPTGTADHDNVRSINNSRPIAENWMSYPGELKCTFYTKDNYVKSAPAKFRAQVYGTNSTAFYQWDFDGDGTIDYSGYNLNNVSHQYSQDGIYSVSLQVTVDGKSASCVKNDYVEYEATSVYYVSKTGTNTPPYDSWNSAAREIQDALALAKDTDTVKVANGTYSLSSTLVIENAICLVSENGPEKTIIDGGNQFRCIQVKPKANSTILIKGFAIQNGLATDNNGGAAINSYHTTSSPTLNLKNCIIQNNKILQNKGGYAVAINMTNGSMSNCIVRNNSCDQSNTAVTSAGVYVGGVSSFTNCLFYNNHNSSTNSPLGTGALFCIEQNNVIQNCTIVDNTGSTYGGVKGGYIHNSIVWSNNVLNSMYSAERDISAESIVQYTCTSQSYASTKHNITNNPRFVDQATRNYRLAYNSPCINKGQYNSWMEAAVDLDNNPRFLYGTVDMGAYEFLGNPEIHVKRGYKNIYDNSRDLINAVPNRELIVKYRIYNQGKGTLRITEKPTVIYSVARSTIINTPASVVPPGGSTWLYIKLGVLKQGKTDRIRVSIPNNDNNENPYDFTITYSYIGFLDPVYPIPNPPITAMSDQGIEIVEIEQIPKEFDLAQNHPNPFNPETTIRFQLPTEATVELTIFNVQGQKVKTLLSQSMQAGVHQVQWNGKNEKGESVPSGSFFYVLQAGEYREVKKMTLLK